MWKKLEDWLQEIRNRLASPPSAIDELLSLLSQTESFSKSGIITI